MITKDAKYAPYCLTEICKQQLKFGTLVLASSKMKANDASASSQRAINRIHAYILILLFKSDSCYEFFPIFRSASDALHKSFNEIYKLKWVVETDDGRISLSKRSYERSPHRKRNSSSYICNIKGVRYSLDRHGLDPFRKAGVSQDEIKNTLSLSASENILQKPVEYFDDSIYAAADIELYELLSEYNWLYSKSRSTLKKLWNLREPTQDEMHWLKRIDRGRCRSGKID